MRLSVYGCDGKFAGYYEIVDRALFRPGMQVVILEAGHPGETQDIVWEDPIVVDRFMVQRDITEDLGTESWVLIAEDRPASELSKFMHIPADLVENSH